MNRNLPNGNRKGTIRRLSSNAPLRCAKLRSRRHANALPGRHLIFHLQVEAEWDRRFEPNLKIVIRACLGTWEIHATKGRLSHFSTEAKLLDVCCYFSFVINVPREINFEAVWKNVSSARCLTSANTSIKQTVKTVKVSINISPHFPNTINVNMSNCMRRQIREYECHLPVPRFYWNLNHVQRHM